MPEPLNNNVKIKEDLKSNDLISKKPNNFQTQDPLFVDESIKNNDEEESFVGKKGIKKRFARSTNMALLGVVILLGGIYYLMSKQNPQKEIAQSIITSNQSIKNGDFATAKNILLELIKKYPARYEAYYEMGKVLTLENTTNFQNGKQENNNTLVGEALMYFKKAFELEPHNGEIKIDLIKSYLASGLIADAQGMLASIDETIEKDLGEGPLPNGNASNPSLQKTQQTEHQSIDFYIHLAELFLRYKNLKEPAEKLLKIADKLKSDTKEETQILGYKLEATSNMLEGKYTNALVALDAIVKKTPLDEFALEATALCQVSLGDVQGAESTINRWMNQKPDSQRAILLLAFIKYGQRNRQEALSLSEKVIASIQKEKPDMTTTETLGEALGLSGGIYWEEGEKDKAFTYLKQSCSLGNVLACNHEAFRLPSSHGDKETQSMSGASASPPPPPPPPSSSPSPTTNGGNQGIILQNGPAAGQNTPTGPNIPAGPNGQNTNGPSQNMPFVEKK